MDFSAKLIEVRIAMTVLQELGGDVTVTFTGSRLTSRTAAGIFTNVPGNSTSPCTLTKGSLSLQQFFRFQGN